MRERRSDACLVGEAAEFFLDVLDVEIGATENCLEVARFAFHEERAALVRVVVEHKMQDRPVAHSNITEHGVQWEQHAFKNEEFVLGHCAFTGAEYESSQLIHSCQRAYINRL